MAEGERRDPVAYADLVEEAICFGWIDSTVNILDDDRGLQLMTPRKPKSGWTRLNRRRVADLEAQGRMTDAGRRVVEAAKANGWWTIYDPSRTCSSPRTWPRRSTPRRPPGTAWDGFPPSARKQMLWSDHRREARDPGQPHRQDRGRGRGPEGPGLIPDVNREVTGLAAQHRHIDCQ